MKVAAVTKAVTKAVATKAVTKAVAAKVAASAVVTWTTRIVAKGVKNPPKFNNVTSKVNSPVLKAEATKVVVTGAVAAVAVNCSITNQQAATG